MKFQPILTREEKAMTGSCAEEPQDVAYFKFQQSQARILDRACRHIAAAGGPETPGTAALSMDLALKQKNKFTAKQLLQLDAFSLSKICVIEFSNRRLLIRLFAYAPHTKALVLQSDPLVVRG
jgi:hypothetical protein